MGLITYLEELLEKLKTGDLVLSHGENAVVFHPKEAVELEIEAKEKDGRQKFSFEMSWKEGLRLAKCRISAYRLQNNLLERILWQRSLNIEDFELQVKVQRLPAKARDLPGKALQETNARASQAAWKHLPLARNCNHCLPLNLLNP